MYVIATIKSWNINNFKKIKSKKFTLISSPKKLTFKYLNKIKPKYVFFPHWNKKVSKKIIDNFYCICFHETDLPYGRGGSPIQNLIIRNKKKTKITAFKMSEKLDAGPIIMKKNLNLNGNGERIFKNCSNIVFKMIKQIIKSKIKLKPQQGKVSYFKRLKNNSEIDNKDISLNNLYNKIRMLDVKSYKRAKLNTNNFYFEFYSAIRRKNFIEAKVKIKKK